MMVFLFYILISIGIKENEVQNVIYLSTCTFLQTTFASAPKEGKVHVKER